VIVMSRIGKKPVAVPSGVKVELAGSLVKVTGPKGNLSWSVPVPIKVAQQGAEVVFSRPDDERRNRALHGLSRALVANMVRGVTEGYREDLEIYGTGYSCKLQGPKLLLNIGYMGRGVGRAAQYTIDIPSDLKVEVQTETARGESDPARFSVSGCDKQKVGQFAAEVRKLRKPEPYKGKGIRYKGEAVRRKSGKVFAGGG